jgi:hypothetical protein
VLKPHLEKVKTLLGKLPGTVIADAGYGGEENYAYLEEEQVEAIVKYGSIIRRNPNVGNKTLVRSTTGGMTKTKIHGHAQRDRNCYFDKRAKKQPRADLRSSIVIIGVQAVKVVL